jgi:hypothetical protein
MPAYVTRQINKVAIQEDLLNALGRWRTESVEEAKEYLDDIRLLTEENFILRTRTTNLLRIRGQLSMRGMFDYIDDEQLSQDPQSNMKASN